MGSFVDVAERDGVATVRPYSTKKQQQKTTKQILLSTTTLLLQEERKRTLLYHILIYIYFIGKLLKNNLDLNLISKIPSLLSYHFLTIHEYSRAVVVESTTTRTRRSVKVCSG